MAPWREGYDGVEHHEGELHEGYSIMSVWHHEEKGVKMGAVMVADDLVLAMRSIHGM